jgi:hypothetical protein
MLSKLSLVLTCGVLASSFSMSAQASPISSADDGIHHVGAQRLRMGLPHGGVRLHS